MWRGMAIATCLTLLVVGVVSGQGQRSPATLDDLLTEIRGLRADLNQSTTGSVRAQLISARLALQEGRINTLAGQLADVRQQLSAAQGAMAPIAAQMKQFQDQDPTRPVDEPFRSLFAGMQKNEQSLRSQEAELVNL